MGINRLIHAIDIKADKSKIWQALWASYSEWAAVFYAGSYAVTDQWKEGSRVLFLGPDDNGIYSSIEKHLPDELMEFRHIGTVVKGLEQVVDEATKAWSGATEIYRITEENGFNRLSIEIDVLDEHLEFMNDKLPLALEKVKEISVG